MSILNRENEVVIPKFDTNRVREAIQTNGISQENAVVLQSGYLKEIEELMTMRRSIDYLKVQQKWTEAKSTEIMFQVMQMLKNINTIAMDQEEHRLLNETLETTIGEKMTQLNARLLELAKTLDLYNSRFCEVGMVLVVPPQIYTSMSEMFLHFQNGSSSSSSHDGDPNIPFQGVTDGNVLQSVLYSNFNQLGGFSGTHQTNQQQQQNGNGNGFLQNLMPPISGGMDHNTMFMPPNSIQYGLESSGRSISVTLNSASGRQRTEKIRVYRVDKDYITDEMELIDDFIEIE